LRRLAGETADAGVRLLVGTRPGGPHRRLITALGLSTRDDDPALIDLDTPAYLSREDLAEYVRRRLLLTDLPPTPGRPDTPYRGREALAGQVAAAVARAAYPVFLIGQLVTRALVVRAEPLSPGDPGWQHFPTTVAEAMDQYLAGVGSQAAQDRVEDLLHPLAYARGDGLPLDDAGLWPQLATALARPGRSYTLGDVATLLDTAADYLIETVITGQAAYYRLYHQALSDRLRERDQQHPRPVSTAQTIYQCLLHTVARHPDGTRDWPTAHPYLHSQLAGHAADVGQLTSLLDDPGFLVAADPAGLFAALQRPGQPPTGNAQIYRHAYPQLPLGADAARERASYLQLAARRHRAHLADQVDQLGLDQPWTTRWIRGQRPHPHYIAGRHDDGVTSVAVGVRQGRPVIVSGSLDGTEQVWDLESGERVLGPLTGHYGGVQAVAVGVRHGRPVIVSGGGFDRTVWVWDLESGEPVLGPLTGHYGGVRAVAVGVRHGRPVIVSGGGFDRTVWVWDLESGEPVLGPLTDRGEAAAVIGVRNGRPVIVSGSRDETVWVWDLESGQPALGPLTGHDGWVNAVAVGERQGRPVIVSGSRDETVRVWDLESGQPVLGPLTGHHDGVNAVAVGERQGRPVIVSGSSDRTVRVWDLESGQPVLGPLTGHHGLVYAVAVGERQGRPVIVSASNDETVQVWDLESGEPALGPLTSRGAKVRAVHAVAVGVRQGRPVIVSGNNDGTVRVWDLKSGEPVLGPLTGHDRPVHAVAVGVRQGRPVIVSGGGETVRVWDLKSGEPVLGPLTGHEGWVNAVAVGERQGRPVIVSGGGDRTVRVWDLESGQPVLGPLTGHDGPVHAVALGERHGRLVIVSGSSDRTVRVWDLEAGHASLRIELQHQVVSVASTADRLVIGTSAELLQVDLL
jgi:WD40 repeat protein